MPLDDFLEIRSAGLAQRESPQRRIPLPQRKRGDDRHRAIITLLCSADDDLHPELVRIFDSARAVWMIEILCVEDLEDPPLFEESGRLFVLCHTGELADTPLAYFESTLDPESHWLGAIRLDVETHIALDAFSECMWAAMRQSTTAVQGAA